MKKIIIATFCAIFFAFMAAAEASKVYVNPLNNSANANSVIAKRLYKKALLGLTKAKTISIVSGDANLAPGSDDAMNYDYIMTIDLSDATISEANSIGNLLGTLGSSKKDPDWEGKLTTNIFIVNAKTGTEVFKVTLAPRANNKDKDTALFNATNNFDYDMTDMTDDAFRISGEIVEATEVDKKNVVKKMRIQVGSKDGARKGQAFEVYKVAGTAMESLGAAKCEQVLSADESILSFAGKKDADKRLSELIQNNDGSYTIEAVSRSKNSFVHSNFPGIDKMFSKEGRPDYMDPFNRTSKPKVAFLAVEINDNAFSAQKNNFQQAVLKGLMNLPSIELVATIYPNVEAARNAGIDGLVDISIDKVTKSTNNTSDGKTQYQTEILYTVAGIDVANNKWIDMKSFSGLGTSTEGSAKADSDALTLMDNRVQKFCEDLFPIAAMIVNPEEVKKDEVKKVRINVGTDMGVKKGMAFDIYEQRKEGGAEARFLLGEGKAEKNGLEANSAILKVKGKNDGHKKLYQLLQNADENTEIVLISKASYSILDRGTDILTRDK